MRTTQHVAMLVEHQEFCSGLPRGFMRPAFRCLRSRANPDKVRSVEAVQKTNTPLARGETREAQRRLRQSVGDWGAAADLRWRSPRPDARDSRGERLLGCRRPDDGARAPRGSRFPHRALAAGAGAGNQTACGPEGNLGRPIHYNALIISCWPLTGRHCLRRGGAERVQMTITPQPASRPANSPGTSDGPV